MANTRAGNIHYFDSTGVLTSAKNIRVHWIAIKTSNATNSVIFRDPTVTGTQLPLGHETSGHSEVFTFIPPAVFPNGLEISTLTAITGAVCYTQGN
jgi:hypothetical protein